MPVHVVEYVRSSDVWNLPPRYIEALRERYPAARFSSPADDAELDAALADAEVVLGPGVNAGNFARAGRLRWVHSLAAGVGWMLFPAFVESDVVLTNSRGIHAASMSEHTIAVMLAFVRRLHVARDAQHAREWTQDRLWTATPGYEMLAGTTMVLVGLGAVGGAIATRARALGVRVIAVRRHPAADAAPGDAAPADEQWGVGELPRLLPLADWLVLAAPLTAETRGLIGATELARLKPSARLVNIGRGKLVDEHALIVALASGRLAGAALDVFEEEPLPAPSPLWTMPEVIVTPHVSGLGPDYWGRAMTMFDDNLRRYLDGAPLRNVVDKRAGY